MNYSAVARGRGRSQYGGRGQGRFSQNFKSTTTQKDIKFYPHTVGSQTQSITYDTVKDHIIQYVQKTYKNCIDIAESLEKEAIKDLSTLAPTRTLSTNTDAEVRKIEQEGYDIEFRVMI